MPPGSMECRGTPRASTLFLRASTAVVTGNALFSAVAAAQQSARNTRTPLFPSSSGPAGLSYPTPGFRDDIGRYVVPRIRIRF